MRWKPADAKRWGTAVHESGHVTVAGVLGATGLSAKLHDPERNGDCGQFTGRFTGTKEEEAVILLAGAAAGRLITGRPHGGAGDEKQAGRLLRRSGTSIADAKRAAELLVRGNRRAIEAGARRLYDGGRI
jgi:hypothetical protein